MVISDQELEESLLTSLVVTDLSELVRYRIGSVWL